MVHDGQCTVASGSGETWGGVFEAIFQALPVDANFVIISIDSTSCKGQEGFVVAKRSFTEISIHHLTM